MPHAPPSSPTATECPVFKAFCRLVSRPPERPHAPTHGGMPWSCDAASHPPLLKKLRVSVSITPYPYCLRCVCLCERWPCRTFVWWPMIGLLHTAPYGQKVVSAPAYYRHCTRSFHWFLVSSHALSSELCWHWCRMSSLLETSVYFLQCFPGVVGCLIPNTWLTSHVLQGGGVTPCWSRTVLLHPCASAGVEWHWS